MVRIIKSVRQWIKEDRCSFFERNAVLPLVRQGLDIAADSQRSRMLEVPTMEGLGRSLKKADHVHFIV